MISVIHRRLIVSALAIAMVAVVAAPVAADHSQTHTGGGECIWGEPDAPIPGVAGKTICDILLRFEPGANRVGALQGYFGTLANILVAIIVSVAVIMIAVGGYFYMTAGGSGTRIATAKALIVSAILGVVLALVSWVILNTINPDLVKQPDVVTGSQPLPPELQK